MDIGQVQAAGYARFDGTEASGDWARAALAAARRVAGDPDHRRRHLRLADTWFVGVDALPTAPDGSMDGVPLRGAWRGAIGPVNHWHPAQLSIVYPGHPGRDPDDSDAAHRFRIVRGAAHVDGLLPVGARRRRYPREFHRFLLGLPLTETGMAPTLCWAGSHRIIARALRDAIGDRDPATVDVTEAYHAARREVFETCEVVELPAAPGEAFLLHRFTLHGTSPWRAEIAGTEQTTDGPADGRMIAFFRPQYRSAWDWLMLA